MMADLPVTSTPRDGTAVELQRVPARTSLIGPRHCAWVRFFSREPAFARLVWTPTVARAVRSTMTRKETSVSSSLETAQETNVPWGADHHREMRRRFPHVIRAGVIGEDLPEEGNRVELDSTMKDSNGIPVPRVVYAFSENTRRMLQRGAQAARQLH